VPNSKIPVAVQKLVKRRAKGYCEYCLAPFGFSPDTFQFDHILPKSKGGTTTPDNLAWADGGCNGFKYNKLNHIDPLTQASTRLYHPRVDTWQDHFQWSEDETMIIGTTPIGRATVDLLKVNRMGNINLRKLLVSVGLHPPQDYPTK